MTQDTSDTLAFTGRDAPLFRLALRTLVLTILTLGIYRFWMRTKLRQYYWSSIRVAGSPLEYTGTGLEKLLGFLIAVVAAALYLVIVNGVLMVLNLSYFQGSPFAGVLSALALAPLIFFAQYRGRRYILSRTRLRGLRFAMEPGAGGYVRAGLGHLALTVLSLGVLYPRMQWKLDQFMTRNSRFGGTRLHMADGWTSLMGPWLWVYVPFIVGVGGVVLTAASQVEAFIFLLLVFLLLPFTAANYYVKSFARRTSAKRIGEIGLTNTARTGRIIGIFVLGLLLISLVTSVAAGLAAGVLLATGVGGSVADLFEGRLAVGAAILTLALYFLQILLLAVLYQVLIQRPLIEHFTRQTSVSNLDRLDAIEQGAPDNFADAEGFADALDVGAGF